MRPIEILYEEFKNNLVGLVNSSGLPPFIIAQVLESILYEVKNLEKVNYENALKLEKQDNNGESV